MPCHRRFFTDFDDQLTGVSPATFHDMGVFFFEKYLQFFFLILDDFGNELNLLGCDIYTI